MPFSSISPHPDLHESPGISIWHPFCYKTFPHLGIAGHFAVRALIWRNISVSLSKPRERTLRYCRVPILGTLSFLRRQRCQSRQRKYEYLEHRSVYSCQPLGPHTLDSHNPLDFLQFSSLFSISGSHNSPS
jgi:hypothetical protein